MEHDPTLERSLAFISYSHRDRTLCEHLAGLLENKAMIQVWYDKELTPGNSFRKEIVDAIRRADFFIVLLSGDSILSEWVLDEVEYAKKLHKRILPVYAEQTPLPDDLDMILQRYQCLFWYLRTSDQQFEDALLRVFRPEAQRAAEAGGKQACPSNEFSAAVNAEMRRMLELERQGRFAECYSAGNACLLGMAYLYGSAGDRDRDKARFYFRIAEYRGNPDGTFYLRMMELEDHEASTWGEPDEEYCAPIVAQIKALADADCEPAVLFMAHLHWYGKFGCQKDLARSAALYERCARAGNARAQYIMASNYYFGDGVEQNYDYAIMYANLAMEQGYLKSWRRWGKFYRDGLAVKQDYEKARRFYEKGAQMGDYNCYNKVGDLLYYGRGFPVDHGEAFRYYLKGEQAPIDGQKYGRWKAKLALGRCYELGHGVARDLETAAEKYLEGYQCGSEECKAGYIRCCEQLKKRRDPAAQGQD